MALDIVNLYMSLISEFFTLSDKAVSSTSLASGVPAFVPQGSNSITISYYISKILAEMSDCVNDVNAVELSGDVMMNLRNLLEIARWRFEDIHCDAWLRGLYGYTPYQPIIH
jgi:exocyst complex component 2